MRRHLQCGEGPRFGHLHGPRGYHAKNMRLSVKLTARIEWLTTSEHHRATQYRPIEWSYRRFKWTEPLPVGKDCRLLTVSHSPMSLGTYDASGLGILITAVGSCFALALASGI